MSTAARDELALLNRDQEKHFTRHPEDVSESASDNDSTTLRSSDDDRAFNSRPSNNMRATTYHIPSNTNFIANTGPKGVIADARSYDTARKRSFRQTLRAYSNGELSPPLFGKSKKKAINFNREKSASPDSSSSTDEDEDFMRTWRANRLDELASMSQDIRTRRSSPSMRKYGTLVTVDPIGYLDAVEKVHADTTVIVLIYDDESASSQMVEDALHSLARKHATVRFIKLHYLDAEMDEIAVPGILAYKGGDCFANLVSVMNEIPTGQGVNSSALELLLQQHKVLL